MKQWQQQNLVNWSTDIDSWFICGSSQPVLKFLASSFLHTVKSGKTFLNYIFFNVHIEVEHSTKQYLYGTVCEYSTIL